MPAPDVARTRARTALAWRRTALGLVGICLVAAKVAGTEGVSGAGYGAALALAVLALASAAVVTGIAERGMRAAPSDEPRQVFALLVGAAVVVCCLALMGVVWSVTA
jgi:uncharacterized membrane protein YidH (DUF202 family)